MVFVAVGGGRRSLEWSGFTNRKCTPRRVCHIRGGVPGASGATSAERGAAETERRRGAVAVMDAKYLRARWRWVGRPGNAGHVLVRFESVRRRITCPGARDGEAPALTGPGSRECKWPSVIGQTVPTRQ